MTQFHQQPSLHKHGTAQEIPGSRLPVFSRHFLAKWPALAAIYEIKEPYRFYHDRKLHRSVNGLLITVCRI